MTIDQYKENIALEEEIKRSYLDYAMSVIIGRALPEVRDGLKPVHRRILYSMYEIKNDYNRPYKKSARIVGDVIGKYHPHGDASVYDALVRMAQDFSLRYLLVDGQGNFGSIDGDAPAAMRYTEVRMTRFAYEFLEDINKDTVGWIDNYDSSLQEPTILPTKIPNLLINGSAGIAVGMATNIPPHNLAEVAMGIVALLDDPNIDVDGLMRYVPGPDFPTRGFIQGIDGIREAYATGRGIIYIRSRVNIETHPRSKKNSIIINELPYQVNKAKLIERIAELVKEKKIEGITDIRDESDRSGMRIVIEIKREVQSQIILNQLFKFTQMQCSFGINFLAIVNNRPELLTLKKILSVFIDHRKEVILKRTIFELKKAQARLHILEGFKIAIESLNDIIIKISTAKDLIEAKKVLKDIIFLSEMQAQAILEMRLQRLTGLEQKKIFIELHELSQEIIKLQNILNSDELVRNIIREEALNLAKVYNDSRRTEIVSQIDQIEVEDMITEEDMVVTLSHAGYIKRTPISLYRAQRRGGRGKKGMLTREEDFVENLFIASTHSYLLVFVNLGRLYWLKVHELPQAGRVSKGKAIVNLLNLLPEEKVTTVLSVRGFTEGYKVIMATRQGFIKKTDLMNFSRPRSGGIIAMNVSLDDRLVSARLTDGTMEIFLATRQGQAIRFKEEQVRSMGRIAAGVRGIALDKEDEVVAMEALAGAPSILTVTANGYGKRTRLDEYPLQNRGGRGVITIKVSKRNGHVVGALVVDDSDNVMLSSNRGEIIRLRVNDISEIGRNTLGVKLKDLVPGESLVSVERFAECEETL